MANNFIMTNTALKNLIFMSHELGNPSYELAILGEGNSSALLNNNSFYIKASGATLQTLEESGCAFLDLQKTLDMLNSESLTDEEINEGFKNAALFDEGPRPSIEAMMHAFLLSLPDVNFVGHTHPIAVNGILCSVNAKELVSRPLFPDQIVCCGISPVFIPYTDPGLPLAVAVKNGVKKWIDKNGMIPKAIMLQNHGLFAIGKTTSEVINCSRMWVKTARIIATAVTVGGLVTMSDEAIERIFTRPDEKFREQIIGK